VRLQRGSIEVDRIDAALTKWRQGDFTLDEQWFVHVGDPSAALTDASANVEDGGPASVTSEEQGLIVTSQTCDIVRHCVDRPFVEVAPLVMIDDAKDFLDVKMGRRPALTTLPPLESLRLAADLNRSMTVEKAVVARWNRTAGCASDEDQRRFAEALSRKRSRFAFPDDFNALVRKLQKRILEKHGKESPEGEALRRLREIRVQPSNEWDAPVVREVFFWFIRDETAVAPEGTTWPELKDLWLKLVPASSRFERVEGQITTLADMKAEDYVHSDRLDLDHLSNSIRDEE